MSGSQNNPIQLLDDDEEYKRNQERVQFERNKQALRQAHMGSQFDVLLAVLKLEIKGSEQQKNRVIKSRIHKFFDHGSKSINVEKDNFRKRRDPDYSHPMTIPVDNQLVIYGVDFLNTKQIRHKFSGSNIDIQWIDDSHCRVKFQNAAQAKKALQSNLKNKNDDIVKLQNQEIQIPRNWFELQPYFYLTFQRRLFARYAANNQDNLQIQKSNDFYMFQQARKKFEESIKNQVQQQYYEVMRKYKLVDEAKIRERERMRFGRDRQQGDRGRFNQGYNYGRRDRQQGMDERDRRRNWDDRPFDRNRVNQRFNNYTRNRDNNRNWNYDNQQFNNQERSREKRGNDDVQIDNMSFVSRGSKASKASNRQRKRKFSASICSQQSPIRNKNDQDDDAKSSLSFIFNLDQQNSSNQIVNCFNNLSIIENSMQQNPNFLKKKIVKQQQLNLSYISSKDDVEKRKQKQNEKKLDLSFNLGEEMRQQNNKNNASFDHNLSIASINKTSFNKKERKQNMQDMSILGDQQNRNKKIDHITIYD